MIRVLHITGTMDVGGIETFLMNVYRNIDRNKVQFDFLLSGGTEFHYSEEIRKLGGKIYSVPSRNGGKDVLKNSKALDDFFRKHTEYKIVHQHVSSLSYITPLLKAKKYHIPTRIVHSHSTQEFGNYLNVVLHYIHKPIISKLATNYFACSSLAAKWVYPESLIKQNKHVIVKNAIDVENYKFDSAIRNKIRRELGISENEIVIGHVGRFVDLKNHKFIIDIFNEITKKDTNFKLLFVGDGILRGETEEKIIELGLKDKVIFTGVRPDVGNLLNAMDIFLFPSLYEGLGMALIEAQSIGLKCFTSDNVVPQEVDVTGLVNFISLNESAKEWAKQILLSVNYNRKDKNKEIVAAGYDVCNITNNLEEFYIRRG